LSREFLGLSPN